MWCLRLFWEQKVPTLIFYYFLFFFLLFFNVYRCCSEETFGLLHQPSVPYLVSDLAHQALTLSSQARLLSITLPAKHRSFHIKYIARAICIAFNHPAFGLTLSHLIGHHCKTLTTSNSVGRLVKMAWSQVCITCALATMGLSPVVTEADRCIDTSSLLAQQQTRFQ